MYIPSVDGSIGEEEWRPFVESHAFGHLIAAGVGRAVPVVAPTQFVLDGDRILLHLAGPNPVFDALAELAHPTRLRAIRAITISMDAVRAKFKYGGNVDRDHRQAVIEKLRSRNGPRDHAAADHTARRSVRSDPTDS